MYFDIKMNKKTIIYVIGSMDLGGAEKHIVNVASMLKKLGWNPEFFVIKHGGPLSKILEQNQIPIHSIELPSWFSNVIRHKKTGLFILHLLSFIMFVYKYWKIKPEITHFFLPTAYIVGGVASLLSPVKIKIMSRRSLNNYKQNNRFLFYIEKMLHKFMDVVCGNSNAILEQLKLEGVDSYKLQLIYNGVDNKKYFPSLDKSVFREKLGISKDALVFVIVANLIPYKGHMDLIQAFGAISDDIGQDWILLCLGRDDGIQNQLYDTAKRLKIDNNIRFLGSQANVEEYLIASDVGILSSHEEGFSNAILECMSSGLPMIVTDVGGNAEAVIDGKQGFVVPSHNPNKLSKAILKISHDTILRNKMGKSARDRALNVFDVDSCIDQYNKMYTKLINQS